MIMTIAKWGMKLLAIVTVCILAGCRLLTIG